jgi:predicted transcriptional regulator
MVSLQISETVAERLQKLAETRGSTIEQLTLEAIEPLESRPRTPTLAELIAIAEAAGFASAKPVDTAANAEGILEREYYGAHLNQKYPRQGHDDDSD